MPIAPLKRQIVLFKLINQIFDTHFKFASHDEARQFFLRLQNQVKNMNFMAFNGDDYRRTWAHIEELIRA